MDELVCVHRTRRNEAQDEQRKLYVRIEERAYRVESNNKRARAVRRME